MAVTVQLTGPALLQLSTNGGTTWQNLGYTRNGAEITLERYTVNVPSDRTGGDAGPPAEVINLGITATIRADLTEFDDTVADIVRTNNGAGFAQLMFSSGKAFGLKILATNQTWTFNRVLAVDPPTENKGTTYTTFNCLFRAYPDQNGVTYTKA